VVLDWNDLKWFVAVADAGSFRTAATATGLNHTTLSRRIRGLEEELGLELVERSSSGLQLTEAGRDLRRSCDVLIAEVADLQRRLAGKDQRPEGKVTLAYAGSLAPFVLEASVKLRALYPEITIVHANSEDFVDLSRREADIAVRAVDAPPESLLGRRIGRLRWGAYGAKSRYPEPLPELVPDEHDWIGLGGRWAEAAPTRWLRDNVPAERLHGEVDDPQSVRELVASGQGLGVLMNIDGDRDPRLTRVGAWPGPSPPGSLWLLVHPEVARARRVRVVADHLYDYLRALDGAFEPGPPAPAR
jgi:DNA-binding transcriptional LysR family regulator